MKKKLNSAGNRRGLNPPAKSHPWFSSPVGKAKYQTPVGFVRIKK